MDLLSKLFSSGGFMPHGSCYTWDPYVIWLHVISDGLIAVAYFSIPLTLLYLVRRRNDLAFNWVFLCFAVFIVACGVTHVMEVWNIWRPLYWLAGLIKAVTAVASLITALVLVRLMPQALAFPSNEQLREVNQALQQRTEDLAHANVEFEQLAAARQQDGAALREAQRLAQLGSWEWVLQPERITWSEELYRTFDCDPGLPPPPYSEQKKMFFPESWARLEVAVENALQHGTPYKLDLELIRPEGTSRWVLAQGESVRDADKRIVGLRGTAQDVTERRRVTQELTDLYEHAPCGYHSIDPEGVFLRINETELSWLGFTREEVIGKMRFVDLLPPGSKAAFEANYARFKTKGWIGDLEFELVRKDGTVLRALVNATAVMDGKGDFLKSRATVYDITERIQAEEMRRKQAQLLDLAHDAIFTRDANGCISSWNPAAERRYGWSRQEVLGQPAHAFLHTCFPQPLEGINAVLLETNYWEGELQHTTRDGSQITVASRWLLQRDPHGRPAGTLEINRDITERERARQALRESEERFRFALSGSHITVFNQDRQLRYSWIHNAGMDDYRNGACLGRTDAEILGGEAGAPLMAIKQRVLDTGIGIRTETSVTARGEQRFLDLTIEPLRDVTGATVGLTCASTDVSALRRSEREVRALNATLEQRVQERTVQLEATNKELEAFSYSVSHDLRAPLRSIDGFSEILLEDHGSRLDPEGTDCVQRIRAASRRMAQLIEDLLDLSKVTRAELQSAPVNLTELVRSVADGLQGTEPERRVQWVIAPDAVAPKADGRLLRIVFENLLGNAWKFVRRQAVPTIEFGAMERDGAAAWYVRDNGAGFDMAYEKKLFCAFQRLHAASEYPGTGIGLVTVQRIIHRHGGRVWAEGAVGKGATFYFTLPA
ncbi:MAG TPA: PAS domain S-box protein [Chthoniobacterales bacterium]